MKEEKKNRFSFLLKMCPYSVLWKAIKVAINERRLPRSARQGALIALLGLFCPLFWIAYFNGASGKELIFHAVHSGTFVVVGLVLMVIGLLKSD